MNKRSRRKGFTTVELVIVIAVIAILATVLIPTFSNLIDKANESAALQEANSILKSYFIDNAADGVAKRDFFIKAKGYYFRVSDGKLQKDGTTAAPTEVGTMIVSSTADDPYYTTEPITEPEEDKQSPNDTPTHDYPCYDVVIIDYRCDICGKHVHDTETYNAKTGWCLFCKP